MMLLGSTLINAPVMSLQTGSELARTKNAVIDPANLAVIAYELIGGRLTSHPTLLRMADVRELSDLGFIVDSDDEFVTEHDVVKLDEIYHMGFEPINMLVTDEKQKKLGHIIDYTLDTSGFFIQQLTVRRPFLRSLNDTELLIHRTQIIEINDKAIVVHSEAKIPEPERHEVVSSYINPFRKPESAPESIDRS
ncbi:MAG: hypothetical protein ABIP74_03915 [Candidatus Saccharimonas sp.]